LDDGLKTIYFKKASGGGCFVATKQCIIIGVFDETLDQSATHCVRCALLRENRLTAART